MSSDEAGIGALLVEGILGALVRRGISGEGALVEVNMLEAALDFQFEPLTIHLQDGSLPERTASNNAHPLIAAPYGVYRAANGYLALAMGSMTQVGELLECPRLLEYPEPASWFERRDEIKTILARHLETKPIQGWLDVLEPSDFWCAQVLDRDAIMAHPQLEQLDVLQTVERSSGTTYRTTVCPIRIDGHKPTSSVGSNALGEHNARIDDEFGLG